MDRPRERWFLEVGLFALVTLVYALFSFWGVRSPDGEVMYRTAESIAVDGDLAIAPLELWPEFGVKEGEPGEFYGKYGPATPFLAAPLAWLGRRLESSALFARGGPSLYVADGLPAFMESYLPAQTAPHARRAVTMLYNVLVGALAAVALFRLLGRFGLAIGARLLSVALYAFGSPMLWFSGTFFCEPLIALCLIAAVDGVVAERLPRAGSWLGLAVLAHVTAITWAPFLAVAAAVAAQRGGRSVQADVWRFAVPLIVAGGLLQAYNFVRFGNAFEMGRPDADYSFEPPWVHIVSMLFALGRGLFVLFPSAVAGIALWGLFVRQRSVLAWLLLGGIATRIVFFAAFHDWHAGFGPGPRYLLPDLALLLIPVAIALDRALRRGGAILGVAVLGICLAIVQQIWFATGEVFTWSHKWQWDFEARGQDVTDDDVLYTAWPQSPLHPQYALWRVGPSLLRGLGIGGVAIFSVATAVVCSLVALTAVVHRRRVS